MSTRVQLDFPALSDRGSRGLPHRTKGGGWFAWILTAAGRWRQRRMLKTLDERTLHDIGISRSQALAEARKPWWRT
jgi:uncharacterized protein YjiS (DUF1127 family)